MRLFLPVLYFYALALAGDEQSIIGYYVDGDKTITAKCTGESASFSTGGQTGGCVHLSLGKYTAASAGYSCFVNTLFESVTVKTGDNTIVDNDVTATTCAPRGDCVTLRIYEASPDVTLAAKLVTCVEQLGLPTSARTLYRQPPGITPKPDSSSGAGASRGSSSSGDANAANTDEESGGSSKAGVIAGAVVGSVSGIGLLIGAFFLYRFLKKRPKPEIPQNPPVEDGPTGPAELGGIGKTAEQIGKPEIDGQQKLAAESTAVFGTGTPATAELGSPAPNPLPHAQELSAQPTAAELPSSTGAYQSGFLGELPASTTVYEKPAEPYTGSNHDPRVIHT